MSSTEAEAVSLNRFREQDFYHFLSMPGKSKKRRPLTTPWGNGAQNSTTRWAQIEAHQGFGLGRVSEALPEGLLQPQALASDLLPCSSRQWPRAQSRGARRRANLQRAQARLPRTDQPESTNPNSGTVLVSCPQGPDRPSWSLRKTRRDLPLAHHRAGSLTLLP